MSNLANVGAMLACAVLWTAALYAQGERGAITGIVKDATGAVVPGDRHPYREQARGGTQPWYAAFPLS